LFNDLLIWDDGKTDPVLLSDETKLKSIIDKRFHFNIRKYGMYDEFGVMRSSDDNVYIFAKFYSEAEDVKLTSYIYVGDDSAMAPDFSCKEKLCCHQCVPHNNDCTCHNIDIPCHIIEKRWICQKVTDQ